MSNNSKAVYYPEFGFGDKVIIDNEKSLVGIVTGILWRSTLSQVEVSWFHSGTHHSEWFAEWRISHWTDQ